MAQCVVFAGEQVIDDLAHAANMDPVAFRIQNVLQGNDWGQGQRRDQLLALLNAVAKAANWQPKVAASNLSDANVVTGRGVAWQDVYNPIAMAPTAAIVDVEVNKKTGKITVKHVYHALSAGLAVYPDGIENQIVGGTVQSLSWTLVEQVAFTKTHVASNDFVTYPLLRFKDAPQVTPIVIQWDTYTDTPYTAGVGESPVVAVPAAVANAFFDATGVRMRLCANDTGPCSRDAEGSSRGVKALITKDKRGPVDGAPLSSATVCPLCGLAVSALRLTHASRGRSDGSLRSGYSPSLGHRRGGSRTHRRSLGRQRRRLQQGHDEGLVRSMRFTRGLGFGRALCVFYDLCLAIALGAQDRALLRRPHRDLTFVVEIG